MTDVASALTDIAAELAVPVGELDAFVFRRVDGGRMVHLGGGGRAHGWAGVIEIHLESEPLIRHAWQMRRPVVEAGPSTTRAFGPYWATSTIIVPLQPDQLVVFGSTDRIRVPDAQTIEDLSWRLAAQVAAVSPAKRLADELEMLHAVRRATATTATTVQDAAEHIVTAAAEALSCELGLLWLPACDVLAVVDRGPMTALPKVTADSPPDGDGLAVMMEQLLAHRELLPRCQQDNALSPLPSPLDAGSAVVAWYAVELMEPEDGLLLLCHTVAKPRGFTLLCQQIGSRIAEAAATPLATAVAHERLNVELARASDEARRDPLTGTANRLAWQEALSELMRDRRGDSASVIMLDLDELKQVNDEYGHRAGDDMLRAIAAVLLGATRARDVVARVGGDEFAILLPTTDETDCRNIVDRIGERIADLQPIGQHAITASIGWASCTGPGSLDEVLRAADRRMYEAKNARTQR